MGDGLPSAAKAVTRQGLCRVVKAGAADTGWVRRWVPARLRRVGKPAIETCPPSCERLVWKLPRLQVALR